MVGPVMSALFDDNTFLFTNAMLDLVTSTVLASTYGIGMLLAAPVLFCWQGTFYLIAKMSSSAISDALIAEVSIVGGVLIVCSGLSLQHKGLPHAEPYPFAARARAVLCGKIPAVLTRHGRSRLPRHKNGYRFLSAFLARFSNGFSRGEKYVPCILKYV